MSHYSGTHVSSRSSRAPRSGDTVVTHTSDRRSRSRTRHSPPVVYSTTRRSSSVGAPSHHAPSGSHGRSQYYTVSDTGRMRRSSSSDRGNAYYYPSSGTHYASTRHAQTPSSHHGHRRSSSHSRTSPTYYTMPASTGYARPRSGSSSSHAHVDARRREYPSVQVMGDTSRHRSSSVERSHPDEPASFGEKMRRLFGLGPSEHRETHHETRHRGRSGSTSSAYYANPGSGKRYRSASRTRTTGYRDARTGQEVDRQGRPVYTV